MYKFPLTVEQACAALSAAIGRVREEVMNAGITLKDCEMSSLRRTYLTATAWAPADRTEDHSMIGCSAKRSGGSGPT